MTPEEEQKLRNFRLLGGGSSMELPQQQQQPTAPLLGQGQVSPNILSQVPGIENVSLAPTANAAPAMRPEETGDIDPSRLSVTPEAPEAPSGYNPFGIGTSIGLGGPLEKIIMNPETWQSRGQRATQRAKADATDAASTQRATADATDAGSTQSQPSIPSGEAGSPQANFANFMQGGGQLSPEQIAQANAFAESMGTTFDPATGYSRQPFLGAQQGGQANAPTIPNAPAQESDPIRSTSTLPNGEVVMERESGERFNPTADQLQSFNSTMQSVSQPTATGMGVGGDEGVVFGGGQAPMSTEETQAMLQERFGAPTISAIQSLPAGQGSGMQTDAQGRMIDPNVDRSDFEQASAEREARTAGRPDFNEPQASQNVPQDVLEAAANPRPTEQQQARLAQWEASTQGSQMGGVQGLQPEQEDTRTPEQIENERLQNEEARLRIQQAREVLARPDVSDVERIAAEADLQGLPENLKRQAIAKKLGLDLLDEATVKWISGETATIPTGGEKESTAETQEGDSTPPASTFDPSNLTGQDKAAYDWATSNPNDPKAAKILAKLGAQ